LVDHGHFPSRARARAAIDAGLVLIDDVVMRKAAQPVRDGAAISVRGDVHDYVSRGGVKLNAALGAFNIDPAGMTCLDLGASTGGFCDVLLRAGAKKIFAVDVGADQLHPKIAGDPRVADLQQTHAKNLSRALAPDPIDLIVCDVSFIGLKKALPPALALAAPRAMLVALFKPQFEVGRERIGKGGIVKASAEEIRALLDDMGQWLESRGWRVLGVIESPIEGGDGNKEFLIGAARKA
jgi:23S rRNA (cytidine1920-2'-O)/16S rRNA (cytidine1409-2'-O)-methyltransferase